MTPAHDQSTNYNQNMNSIFNKFISLSPQSPTLLLAGSPSSTPQTGVSPTTNTSEKPSYPREFLKISNHAYVTPDIVSSKRPIVIVSGWLDAKLRHAAVYVAMYQAMGFPVILLQSVSEDFIYRLSYFVHRDTSQVLDHMIPTDSVFIPHLMSNGGLNSFYCLLSNLKRKIGILAMVIDSAPSHPQVTASQNATNPEDIFFNNVENETLKQFLQKLMATLLTIQKYVAFLFPSTNLITKNYYQLIQRYPGIPKLFLYSDKDAIIRPENIRQTIKECKKTSIVESHNFQDSTHCRHIDAYKEVYFKKVLWFLETYLPYYIQNVRNFQKERIPASKL